jgi:hypothetical protein
MGGPRRVNGLEEEGAEEYGEAEDAPEAGEGFQ